MTKKSLPKVYLSSTCYDLEDIRSSLVTVISRAGFDIIASDHTNTSFRIFAHHNSVETCLTNVSSADFYVLLLDRRYGPPIPGFDNKSATHLEHLKAKELRIPTVVMVRDDFLKDHRVWQQMKKRGVSSDVVVHAMVHVHTAQRCGQFEFDRLFDFFEETRKALMPTQENWYEPFRNVGDLEMLLVRRLRELASTGHHTLRSILITGAPSSTKSEISLSSRLVVKAIAHLDKLDLPLEALGFLAEQAILAQCDFLPLIKELPPRTRQGLLLRHLDVLLRSPDNQISLARFADGETAARLKENIGRQLSFVTVSRILSAAPSADSLNSPLLRERVNQFLATPFTRAYNQCDWGEDSFEMDERVGAIEVLEQTGTVDCIPYLMATLGDRGTLWQGGDPEHGDMNGHLSDFRHGNRIFAAALKCLRALAHRGLRRAIMDALFLCSRESKRSSLRINAVRAILTNYRSNAKCAYEELFLDVFEKFPNDGLVYELARDLHRCGVNVERQLQHVIRTYAASSDIAWMSLVEHASDHSLEFLLEQLDLRKNEGDDLHDITHVLKYFVTKANRKRIVDALTPAFSNDGYYAESLERARWVLKDIGLRELSRFAMSLPYRNAHLGDENKVREEIVADIERVETLRHAGQLLRKCGKSIGRSYSFEWYKHDCVTRECEIQWLKDWIKSR